MTLDTIDWTTITRIQARRLVPAAAKREQALARKVNAGGLDETPWLAALHLEEDLHVYAVCGEKPVAAEIAP